MDFCVQLSFDNINAPEINGYGVDHIAVARGLGCKAIRVSRPDDMKPAFAQARTWMTECQVPVVVEIILERVTNVAMGTEIDNVVEFDDVLDVAREPAAPSGIEARASLPCDAALIRARLRSSIVAR